MTKQSIQYKNADSEEEYRQIHELNYQTFVEEIPQHEKNETRKLVDRFHTENTYIIAKESEIIIGMIAVRATRPFSLDQKLPNLDSYLHEVEAPCEIRLLSIHPEYRKGSVFFGLIDQLIRYCLQKNYDAALISGTEREWRLYRKLGFEPFGPMTGQEGAKFQPMKLTKHRFVKATQAFHRILARYEPISFLSGPVAVKDEVKEALAASPLSHRSGSFISQMKTVRNLLTERTNAKHVTVSVGTGTLANDVVAQQIKQLDRTGLILSNGEFGDRLMDHAHRTGLDFYRMQKAWNEPINLNRVRDFLKEHPSIGWIWCVHCETSTGYLFDVGELKKIADSENVKLCLDACSSLGADPLDLSGVHIASSVSGKALASYPGLAIVFHNYVPVPDPDIPKYLDLGVYDSNHSIPYTHSTNLVHALEVSLSSIDERPLGACMMELRNVLGNQGLKVLGDHSYSNGIVTIALPDHISQQSFGERLKKNGIFINYESSYLARRNWVQIALMGDVDSNHLLRLGEVMNRVLSSETLPKVNQS
ncbi:MAG: GNAT family N-acetyltransferase [Halobacillus sp.]|uniref:GNAT family N-acetyltransferase n=1 Tax=Halobacillus sp. TaxID=56800 RepID=UPI003BAF484F